MSDKCSELFYEVFNSRVSGCYRQCACGIHHYDSVGSYDWDDGELENLNKKALEEPYKYIAHDHSVGTIIIGSMEIVMDCTCDLGPKYERFILRYQHQLAEYLNKRCEQLKAEADKIKVVK